MRTTWSTVLCAAAVLLLLLSGDEPGDGMLSGPHLSQADVESALAHAQTVPHAKHITGVLSVVTGSDGPLPPQCIADDTSEPLANTQANYTAVLRALVDDGWYTYRRSTAHGFTDVGLSRGGWNLTVSRSLTSRTSAYDPILLYAVDTTCG